MTTTEQLQLGADAQARIVVGCDCFDCANTFPGGALTFRAVDCSHLFLYPAGTKYRVTRSDGVDFGQMFKHELLAMRAAYGSEITFCEQ
jgi:hypothetical protein